uniref:Uncharacterized protein n=1 Tax=Manihot esculenta TaxID=3983 RepID=A0A2C9VAU5_MANES
MPAARNYTWISLNSYSNACFCAKPTCIITSSCFLQFRTTKFLQLLQKKESNCNKLKTHHA